jgi:hypothetical protein
MHIQKTVEQNYKLLRDLAFCNKLLLISPIEKYANLIIARLANDETSTSFYYELQVSDNKANNFVENLITQLELQAHDVKTNYLAKHSISRENQDLDSLAKYLAQYLKQLSAQPYLLIISDFDIAEASEEIQGLIKKLLNILPSQVHIIMKSRDLPRLGWFELLAEDKANIFLDGSIVKENFYNNSNTSKTHLNLYALDGGQVTFQGENITNWEGFLPRALLFFVVDRGRVTRSEICSAFWPTLSIDQAINVFHVTKRRLHKAIGTDIIVHSNDHYSINPEVCVQYDVEQFIKAVTQARNSKESSPLWNQAIQLYKRPFLEGEKEQWIQDSRNAYETAFNEAKKAIS